MRYLVFALYFLSTFVHATTPECSGNCAAALAGYNNPDLGVRETYTDAGGVVTVLCSYFNIHTKSVVNINYFGCEHTCPDGSTLDLATGQCYPHCASGESITTVGGTSVCTTGCENPYMYAGMKFCGQCQENGQAGATLDDGNQCMTPPSDPCTPTNPAYQGTVNGKPICNPDANCPTGSAGGVVNGQFVCVPNTQSPPTCQPGTMMLSDGGGGFACVPTQGQPNQPPPVSDPTQPTGPQSGGNPPSTPTGGSGDPTSTSGNNNYSPTPCDPSDPACQKNTDKQNSVSGGGDCDYQPVCSGDPIACSILMQTWHTRCDGADLTSFNSNAVQHAANVANQANTVLDDNNSAITTLASNPGSSFSADGYSSGIGSLFHSFFPTGSSCTAITLVIPHFNHTITISCVYGNLSKELLGWFLNAACVLHLYNLLFRRVEE